MAMAHPLTVQTTPHRRAERASADGSVIHRVLDEVLTCHLAVIIDGAPWVAPFVHARIGSTVYLHSSRGGSLALAVRQSGIDGLPMSISVAVVDELALGASPGTHSVNYRSVVAHGTVREITDREEILAVAAALLDRLAAGRSADIGRPADRDLDATAVLAVELREVSAKVRTGPLGPSTEPEPEPVEPAAGQDRAVPWTGTVPVAARLGPPRRTDQCRRHLPGYLGSPWWDDPVLTGRHVRLEPLRPAHASGLHDAGTDPEVWRWLGTARPRDPIGMQEWVAVALAGRDARTRLPWAQIDLASGRVAGTTSYYDISPQDATIAIGHTWLGRPWWRTAINTEAKLMLLGRAFDDLGAVRVTWHTDALNQRSQQAIERLGGTREGIVRSHRWRPDGSRRDTVVYGLLASEWPAARTALLARMRAAANVLPPGHDGHHDDSAR
jgi:RimJ/RimL family protein N-acetyltransferase/nitroimidazol reductase NimA-like FMN-containing flavoprotein (pyridoxamine 5'-phosphate oxidase superfamily)